MLMASVTKRNTPTRLLTRLVLLQDANRTNTELQDMLTFLLKTLMLLLKLSNSEQLLLLLMLPTGAHTHQESSQTAEQDLTTESSSPVLMSKETGESRTLGAQDGERVVS